MTTASHRAKIRAHMETGWITPLDALRLYKCLSLSQRLSEIRKDIAGTKWYIAHEWRVTKDGKRIKAHRLMKVNG